MLAQVAEFILKQEDLDEEARQVLLENLWELYGPGEQDGS